MIRILFLFLSLCCWLEAEDFTDTNWDTLRHIQARRVPELALGFRHDLLDAEIGMRQNLRLRFESSRSWATLFHLRRDDRFERKNKDNSKELLSASWSQLYSGREDSNLLLQMESGHQNRLGGAMTFEAKARENLSFTSSISSLSGRDSLAALQYRERLSKFSLGASWLLPTARQPFLFSSAELYTMRIDREGPDPHGYERALQTTLGMEFFTRRDMVTGWQFFDESLVYPTQTQTHLRVYISSLNLRFMGNQTFDSFINRTKKSDKLGIGSSGALSISKHFAWSFALNVAQDLARSLKFAKIIELETAFLTVPSHWWQMRVVLNHSTETSGNVQGANTTVRLAFHVNL